MTKRITLFAGHYGSGKTNIAVNYAFELRRQGLEVAVADLDIVNPYFRTKDSEKELAAAQDKLDFINKKLNNPGFVNKAPEKVVAQNREDAAKLVEKIAQIKSSIEEIG